MLFANKAGIDSCPLSKCMNPRIFPPMYDWLHSFSKSLHNCIISYAFSNSSLVNLPNVFKSSSEVLNSDFKTVCASSHGVEMRKRSRFFDVFLLLRRFRGCRFRGDPLNPPPLIVLVLVVIVARFSIRSSIPKRGVVVLPMRNSSPVSSSSSLLNTTNRAKVIYRIEYREVTLSNLSLLGKEKKKRVTIHSLQESSSPFLCGQPQKTAFFLSFLRWFEFFSWGRVAFAPFFTGRGASLFFRKAFFVPFLPLLFWGVLTSKSHHLSDTYRHHKRADIYLYVTHVL